VRCSGEDCDSSEKSFGQSGFYVRAFWFFFIGQLLHGAGASPLYTLGVTYIDENVSKKMSSVYIGEPKIVFSFLAKNGLSLKSYKKQCVQT